MNLGAAQTWTEMLSFFRGVTFHEELHVLLFFFFLNKRSKEKINNDSSLRFMGYLLCFLLERKSVTLLWKLITEDFEGLDLSTVTGTIGKILWSEYLHALFGF